MSGLSCFFHPEGSFAERSLEDLCPHCRRAYGFPLSSPPDEIRGPNQTYDVIAPVARGFYGATYLAEQPPFGRKVILKVVPRSTYEYFGKNFERECHLHHTVASDTEHLVHITDFFDSEVQFRDGSTLACHVAVLDHVDGERLDLILDGTIRCDVHILAQVAIDLFRMLGELERRQLHHNDLQAHNLIVQTLPPDRQRTDAVEPRVRLVAIDFGSVAPEPVQDSESTARLSDLHSIAAHLRSLVDQLLRSPDDLPDLTYRVARALDDTAAMLTPPDSAHNVPGPDELARHVKDAVERVTAPWRRPLTLRQLSHYDNAQQLEGWEIPQLLEDPDGHWTREISGPGPTLISGMRGCGKTMLLRALELHARLMVPSEAPDADPARRVKEDGYLGLYFPGLRLMERPGLPDAMVADPYARLFVGYALQALRAVHHLSDVAPSSVPPGWHRAIGESVGLHVSGAGPEIATASTAFALENELVALQVAVGRDEAQFGLTTGPQEAFPHLAAAVRSASDVTRDSKVLFLLDDVSTRYLKIDRIADLFSRLLFQDPVCAFKLTSERQTVETLLRAANQAGAARRGRDYDRFDLGDAIYEKISGPGKQGQQFISKVLERRASLYTRHSFYSPADILGDAPMEEIAESIASVSASAPERKAVYHGLTALTKLCAGDMSEVIRIYDEIQEASTNEAPRVSARIQSRIFQHHCSGRLLDLKRRDQQSDPPSRYFDFALGFALASHELMMQSFRNPVGRGGGPSSRDRLRQYGELYVNLTPEIAETQFETIAGLVDAGVFVFKGGTDAPRTKTRDENPTQHFKLGFRKILGLSSFIGVAGSDRFELSGDRLSRFLSEPEHCKDILLEGLLHSPPTKPTSVPARSPRARPRPRQPSAQQTPLVATQTRSRPTPISSLAQRPIVHELDPADQILGTLRHAIVGLGFEDRTLASTRRLLDAVSLEQATLVSYSEPGRAAEIRSLIASSIRGPDDAIRMVNYSEARLGQSLTPSRRSIIDITGLAKPVVFHAVRESLIKNGEVFVFYTNAETYWPRESELLAAETESVADDAGKFDILSKVHTGEHPPYHIDALLVNASDETRWRMLSAAASPRHARLLHLLSEMSYDRLAVLYPTQNTKRAEVAKLSARIAMSHAAEHQMFEVSMENLEQLVLTLGDQHARYFDDYGYNVELGLTGNKLHAVACAAISAAVRISRCWYVSPRQFEPQTFSTGVGTSRVFRIGLSGTSAP